MLALFDTNTPVLFFPVRWANAVTNWLNGLCSKSGTILVNNTPEPTEGGGCSIDVNVDVLYQQLLPRLREEFVSKASLAKDLEPVTGYTVQVRGGRLEVNDQHLDDQRNLNNNVFAS